MKDTLLTDKEFWFGLREQNRVKKNVKVVLSVLFIFTFAYFSKQNNDVFWSLSITTAVYLPLYLLYRVLFLRVYTVKVSYKESEILNYIYSSSEFEDMMEIVCNLRQTFDEHEFKYYKNRR